MAWELIIISFSSTCIACVLFRCILLNVLAALCAHDLAENWKTREKKKEKKNQIQSLGTSRSPRTADTTESGRIRLNCRLLHIHTYTSEATNSVSLELREIPVLSVYASLSCVYLQNTREKVDEYLSQVGGAVKSCGKFACISLSGEGVLSNMSSSSSSSL